jgi:AraC family transcriptional regulator
MTQASLDLQIRPDAPARQDKQAASFRGFFAERVLVGGEVAYDYSWVGDREYLAIHDIDVKQAEISVDGGPAVPVTDLRGRLTFAPQGCSLSGSVSTVNRMNGFTSITFDPAILSQELENTGVSTSGSPLVHFRNTTLEATMWKLDAALKTFQPADSLYLETLALAAVLELGQCSAQLPPILPESGRLSATSEKRIKDFIESHLTKAFTLTEMASEVGLSRFHFSRAFKTTFGLPPMEYVLWSRVEQAKLLLAGTKTPIPDVAEQVGFANPDRLTNSFKRFAGLTPSQFRRST